MEKEPKKRVIFDEDVYDEDFLREYLADDYEMYKDELEVDFDTYVEEKSDRLFEVRDEDYREEMAALKAFFDGKPSAMSSEVSEHGSNPIIVSGTIGRWDGTRSGFTVFDDLDDVTHGQNSPFKDCEIQKVWDENGHLFIHGAHHDGSVTVELRQLSDEGHAAYDDIAETWANEPFTALGKTYDGSEQSVIEAMRDLWDATEPPRYMERAFGCPAAEWNAPENPTPCADLYVGQWRVHLIRPAERLGLGITEDSEYDLNPGRYAGEGVVQFYDLSVDPKDPVGELAGQFGLGSLVIPSRDDGLSSIERCAKGDGLTLYPRGSNAPAQHLSGDALRAVDAWARDSYERLGGRLPEREPEETPERAVCLEEAAQASRTASQALSGHENVAVPSHEAR